MTILPGVAVAGAADGDRLTARCATAHGMALGYADGRVALGHAEARVNGLVREIAEVATGVLAVSTLHQSWLMRLPSLGRRRSLEGRLAGYGREQNLLCLADGEGTETAVSFLRHPSLTVLTRIACATPFGVDEVHFSPGEGRYAVVWLHRRQPFADTLFPLRFEILEEDRSTRRLGRLADLTRGALIPSFSVESWAGPGGFSLDGAVYEVGEAGHARRFNLKTNTWEDQS
ncbi:MAG: hypothetical protein FJW40_16260 [Acidobacteria bacterium]|nr:hypothetical protein [Acidobacteriota bacterium]